MSCVAQNWPSSAAKGSATCIGSECVVFGHTLAVTSPMSSALASDASFGDGAVVCERHVDRHGQTPELVVGERTRRGQLGGICGASERDHPRDRVGLIEPAEIFPRYLRDGRVPPRLGQERKRGWHRPQQGAQGRPAQHEGRLEQGERLDAPGTVDGERGGAGRTEGVSDEVGAVDVKRGQCFVDPGRLVDGPGEGCGLGGQPGVADCVQRVHRAPGE